MQARPVTKPAPWAAASCLLLALFGFSMPTEATVAAARAEAREPSQLSLNVTVLGADGEPVEGVAVILERAGERPAPVASAETGADGGYRFDDLAAGPYRVTVEAPGYVRSTVELTLSAGQARELEVVLESARFAEAVTVTAATDTLTATKSDTPLAETPQSISVIPSAQLDAQEVTTVAEALRYTPGVQGEPFGFEPRFTLLKLRGFSAFTTGFYRDGLQLRNPGFAVGYNLEPYGAEQIAVLRGPASVLYGAGSPGGLVNVVTKRPPRTPLRELEFEPGSFDRLQGKFDLGGPVDAAGTFSYRLTGLLRDSDTQVDFVQNDRVYLAPALTWRPGPDTSLTVLSHYQRDETRSSQALPASGTLTPNPNGTIPTSLFTGEPGVDRYDRRELSIGHLLEHRFGGAWTLRQKSRYYTSDLDDVTVFSAALRPDGRTLDRFVFGSFGDLHGLALDNQAQVELATGSVTHTLLMGLDFQRVEVGSVQTFGLAPPLDIFDPDYGAAVPEPPPFKDADTTQTQVGFYVQDQLELGDRWTVLVGGRYDSAEETTENLLFGGETEQEDGEFTGRAGVVYVSDSGLAPYLSYSESFLPVVGTNPAGEPFDPETGRQFEAGVKYQPPESSAFVTFAVFDLLRQDVVQFDPATFLQVQTGEIRSRGLELEAVGSFDFGLDVIGNYTFLEAEITESNVAGEIGESPAQVPQHSGSLWGEQTIRDGALEGLSVGVGVRYLGSTYGNVPNTLEAPAATLVDAAVRYDWRDLRFGVHASNLFDKEYVASCFVRGGNFCTFGAVRTVTTSVRYDW